MQSSSSHSVGLRVWDCLRITSEIGLDIIMLRLCCVIFCCGGGYWCDAVWESMSDGLVPLHWYDGIGISDRTENLSAISLPPSQIGVVILEVEVTLWQIAIILLWIRNQDKLGKWLFNEYLLMVEWIFRVQGVKKHIEFYYTMWKMQFNLYFK